MCNQSLFKWWCHLHYWRNNSQRQFEHRKFDAKLNAKIIAKDNLNIENLMRTFENVILQNYSTKFLDITYK